MICPNCGNEIEDDKLLCEVCGAEINFVPDFDPELEQSITDSLSDIRLGDFTEEGIFDDGSEKPVFGYYDEEGNFIETPGYFDENGNFVEMTGYYDDFGNFIQTIPVLDENGNEVYVPGYFDENGEPVFFDPYEGEFDSADGALFENKEKVPEPVKEINKRKENKPKPSLNIDRAHKNQTKPEPAKSKEAAPAKRKKEEPKTKDTIALTGISAPERGPKVVHKLSDTLYDEMYKDSTLTEFDSDYEIDPFDDFAYESYYLKKFIRFITHSKAKWFVLAGLVLLVIVIYKVAGSISTAIYQSNSYEYQVQLADKAAAEGNYDQAIEYMEKALSLNSNSSAVKYKLSQYYFKVGKNDDALLMLWEIINLNDGNAAIAYNDMVSYYVSVGDYAMAAEVLQNCFADNVKQEYIDYMVLEPEFSVEEGTYDDEQTLYLSSPVNGTIYYTLDGSEATTESDVYNAPIQLEKGITRVSALFVNNYGIASNAVSKTYTIDKSVPNAPIVMTEEGDYEEPELIEVDVQTYTDVYYTLDGTVPTMGSQLYLSPIPMPIGASTLIFIAYSQEGIPGPITEVSYNLTVDTELNVDGVVGQLLAYNKNTGRAVDYNGLVAGGSTYQYSVSQAIKFDENIYYIFVESINDMFGNNTKTGNMFLVNVKDGSILTASKDTMGNIIPGTPVDPALLVQIAAEDNGENNGDN